MDWKHVTLWGPFIWIRMAPNASKILVGFEHPGYFRFKVDGLASVFHIHSSSIDNRKHSTMPGLLGRLEREWMFVISYRSTRTASGHETR